MRSEDERPEGRDWGLISQGIQDMEVPYPEVGEAPWEESRVQPRRCRGALLLGVALGGGALSAGATALWVFPEPGEQVVPASARVQLEPQLAPSVQVDEQLTGALEALDEVEVSPPDDPDHELMGSLEALGYISDFNESAGGHRQPPPRPPSELGPPRAQAWGSPT